MAITDQVPGLEVSVYLRNQKAEVNERKAKEFNEPCGYTNVDDDDEVQILASATKENSSVNVTVSDTPHVIKYIEVESGQYFAIQVDIEPKMHRPSHHVLCRFEVDAERCSLEETRTNKKRHAPSQARASYHISRDDQGGFRKTWFRFKDLVFDQDTNDDSHLRDENPSQCGVLKMKLYHMRHSPNPKKSEVGAWDAPKDMSMSEKDLKGQALSLRVGLISEPTSQAPQARQVEIYHDPKQRPFATFEFKYRTREGLIQEGIIPPPSLEDQVREMSEADVRQEYLRHLQDQKRLSAESTAKKEEPGIKSEVGDVWSRGIKREASDDGTRSLSAAPRRKERRLENGRVEASLLEDEADLLE